MRAVIQRVLEAKVSVDGNIKSQIESGLVIFLGIYPTPLIDIMKTTMSEIIFRVEASELLVK